MSANAGGGQCRFRGALAERGLAEALFAALSRQLDAKGLVLKAGTLIDATLVETSVARPPQREGEVSTLDPAAGFTRRGQHSFFGIGSDRGLPRWVPFKAHLAVNLGADPVRGAILTGADVGDSLAADALVQGGEDAVFADKAHDSTRRHEALAEAGIVDAIMHRGHARRRLVPAQRWMNAALAPIRGRVERAFGTLKRSDGWRRGRYRGLARDGAHLHLLCTAMNLRRAERLIARRGRCDHDVAQGPQRPAAKSAGALLPPPPALTAAFRRGLLWSFAWEGLGRFPGEGEAGRCRAAVLRLFVAEGLNSACPIKGYVQNIPSWDAVECLAWRCHFA